MFCLYVRNVLREVCRPRDPHWRCGTAVALQSGRRTCMSSSTRHRRPSKTQAPWKGTMWVSRLHKYFMSAISRMKSASSRSHSDRRRAASGLMIVIFMATSSTQPSDLAQVALKTLPKLPAPSTHCEPSGRLQMLRATHSEPCGSAPSQCNNLK